MPATIYFSGAITGGRDDVPLYRQIVQALEEDGHRVLAGGVASAEVGRGGEPLSREEIFTRDMAWIGEAEILVAEVSTPSLGVGYEIAVARHVRGIPVICLFRPCRTPRVSAMIGGDAGIESIDYDEESIDSMLSRLRLAARRHCE